MLDFLPVIERRVTRQGFLIDHITYFGDVLKPWIASRDRLEKFIIRRDPRDLSRVWVLDPESKLYFDIPYRNLSRPPVTQWEHRKAVESLRKRGLEQVDEAAIFSMIEEMREITERAVKERKRARRDKNRRAHLVQKAEDSTPVVSDEEIDEDSYVKPFEVEEWLKSVDIAVPDDEAATENLIEAFDVEEW